MKPLINKLIHERFLTQDGDFYFGLFITLLIVFGCGLGLLLRGMLLFVQDRNAYPRSENTLLENTAAEDSPINTPAQTALSPQDISLTATSVPAPQPTPDFHGFERVVVLSNNILLAPKSGLDLENIIESLAVLGMGGGGDPCAFFDEDNHWGIGYQAFDIDVRSNVVLCLPDHYMTGTAELIHPDGAVSLITIEGTPVIFGNSSYTALPCIDRHLLLQTGNYSLRMIEPEVVPFKGDFEVQSTDDITVVLDSCENVIKRGRLVRFFFQGFQPYEDARVLLYYQDSENQELTLVNSWIAELDQSGRLVQEIPSPEIDRFGRYMLVVAGNQSAPILGFESTDGSQLLEASAVSWFSVSK